MERKLAAILAADVVGYSALMEHDEAGTFDRLKAGRKELFEPEIEKRHGHIFKLMGDGLLAEFSSVVDAVECAVSLQRGLAERNALLPEEQRIQVRIGINLGEVIVEGRTATAKASISLRDCSNSPSRGASVSPARWRTKLKRSLLSVSSLSVTSRLRTSLSRYPPIAWFSTGFPSRCGGCGPNLQGHVCSSLSCRLFY